MPLNGALMVHTSGYLGYIGGTLTGVLGVMLVRGLGFWTLGCSASLGFRVLGVRVVRMQGLASGFRVQRAGLGLGTY